MPESPARRRLIDTAYTREQAATYEEERFRSSGGQQVHAAELAQLRSAYERVPANATVLEVGSGTGRFLPLGRQLGHRLVGIDASQAMMSESPSRTAEFVAGAAGGLPFADDAFDFTYAIRLLSQTESKPYALAVIAEMIRVTKPGGSCLIECLSADRWTLTSTPQIRLTVDEITAACAGAEVVSVAGRFMIGMTPLRRMPALLAVPAAKFDEVLSRLSPRRCSRIYVVATVSSASRSN